MIKRPTKSAGPKPKRRSRRIKFAHVPIRILIPNIITLLSLCSGLTAIRLGIDGRFELAVAAVLIATALDAIDGQVARLLKGTTRFGAELDSLADFVNFGVVPGVLVYLWSLHVFNNIGWMAILTYALCMAMRLARFNVALDDPDKPAWTAGYFSGVPAPAGAGLVLLPMYVSFLGHFDGPEIATALIIYCPMIAILLVSPLPTFSVKLIGNRVRRDMVMPSMGLVVLFTALLFSFPWLVLTVIAIAYAISIPFAGKKYAKQMAEHERELSTEAGNAGTTDVEEKSKSD